jgi:hypothetical protein
MYTFLFVKKFSTFTLRKTIVLQNQVTLKLIKGDIFKESADAIVSTCNRRLQYDTGLG